MLMEPCLWKIAWLSHVSNISSSMLSNARKSNITNTINWINLTFMPYDILLSYHRICIIHKQWTKKERLCIHYICQQSCIKQIHSTFVLKLTSVCLCLRKMGDQKWTGVCSWILFYLFIFQCFGFFSEGCRKISQDIFPEFTT